MTFTTQRKLYPFILCLFVIGLVIGVGSCTQKKMPTPTETLMSLQQMQEMATVEYSLSKVIKASDDKTWYKWGDRSILITCEATLKAGIDLGQLTADKIKVSEKSISLTMPAPKIISINLPPDKIKVAYQAIGFFRSNFSVQEQNNLVAQAEQQIKDAAATLGILEQAKLNTQSFFTQYLLQLGFENIDIRFETLQKPVAQ